MTDLSSLIARVEVASGGDFDLDTDIAKRFGCHTIPIGDGIREYPRVTSSIDAALTLVERLLPGWAAQCLFAGNANAVLLYKPTVPFSSAPRGDSGPLDRPTPALAILLALLKALETKS